MAVRVQIFARATIAGEVKTRLIPRLGAHGAAHLQQALTAHAIRTAVAAELGPIELWCTPDPAHPSFTPYACSGATLYCQGSGDLGERMRTALTHALDAGDFAILIGSDCPGLTVKDLQGAANALEAGVDAAFVPAEDGGYVLIAVQKCSHRLFDRIAWGSDTVMEQTRDRLRELAWTWKELPARWDIDRPEDYERLLREQPQFAGN